jgi:hypothetical protein
MPGRPLRFRGRMIKVGRSSSYQRTLKCQSEGCLVVYRINARRRVVEAPPCRYDDDPTAEAGGFQTTFLIVQNA